MILLKEIQSGSIIFVLDLMMGKISGEQV